MIIVLDTNVLVSAVLKPSSKPAAIVRMILNSQIQITIDSRILMEYRQVLLRPLFHFTVEQVNPLLDFLQNEGELTVGLPLPAGLPDPSDEPFLEVALSARVDALVTGNKRHFPQKLSMGIRILLPSEFLEFLKLFDPSKST